MLPVIVISAIGIGALATARRAVTGGGVRRLVMTSLVVAWSVVCFAAVHRTTVGRDPLTATSGSMSVENVIELISAGAGLLVAWSVLARPSGRPTGRSLWLMSFGLLALVSSLWSVSPFVTVGRALSVLAVGALAMATAGWLRPGEVQVFARAVLRVYVMSVAVLASFGIVTGTRAGGRLTWPGVHPGYAATIAALAVLITLGFGSTLFVRRRTMAFVLVPTAVLFVGAYTRGAWVALVAGALTLWLTQPTKQGRQGLRVAAAALLLVVVVLVAPTQRDLAVDLAARGEDPVDLRELNGRSDLWNVSVEVLREEGRVPMGFGYTASRTALFELRPWAGTAHNGWVQIGMDLGLAGLGLAIVLSVGYVRILRRCLMPQVRSTGLALGVALLVLSITSESMVLPGPSLALAFLFGALALTSRKTTRRREATPAGQDRWFEARGVR